MTRNLLLFALAAALGARFALPSAANAQVTEVAVRVDGVACPFCAYSLEKRLQETAGVGSLTIDIEEGEVIVLPASEERIDLRALPDAVRKAGFTPREISVKAVGRLEAADRTVLVGAGGGAEPLFRLEAGDLLAGLEPGGEIEVSGVLQVGGKDDPSELPVLALTEARSRRPEANGP